MLVLLPFATVRRLLEHVYFFAAKPTQGKAAYEHTRLIGEAISKAQCIILWKRSLCLVNALVAKYLLERRGIACELYLGIRKSGGRLEAHAWVKSQGQLIVGNLLKQENYTPLVCFPSVGGY